jgi:hypothetical protein
MECLGQNQKGNLIYKTTYKEYWELADKHRINNTDIYIIDDKGYYVCGKMIWGYTSEGRDLPPHKRVPMPKPINKKPVESKPKTKEEAFKKPKTAKKEKETAKEISFSLLDDKWLETSEEVERILKEASSK